MTYALCLSIYRTYLQKSHSSRFTAVEKSFVIPRLFFRYRGRSLLYPTQCPSSVFQELLNNLSLITHSFPLHTKAQPHSDFTVDILPLFVKTLRPHANAFPTDKFVRRREPQLSSTLPTILHQSTMG